MIFQTAQNQSDPIAIILNLAFFLLIFISMFYGTRIQAWRSERAIREVLDVLAKWNTEVIELTVEKFSAYTDGKMDKKDLSKKLADLIDFVMIMPVSLDPYGIIPKIEHIMDVRESKYMEEVRSLAVKADEIKLHNLENLLEASMAVNQIYRLLLHYLLIGKRSKSYILLMQVEMQLSLLKGLAKTYLSAARAFAEGTPIGDSLGPFVAASFVREAVGDGELPEPEDIAYQTICQKVTFEERTVYVVRAKGPGGTVGKPGEAIKILIERYGDSIKRIITVDAGLKLEGDKTGSVVTGVGAAIGGIGVEKYKIEDSGTKREIPLDAVICRQSLEDAICTMRKSIVESVPSIIDRVKYMIRKYTEPGDSIILAGIGNTIGIGI